MATISPMLTTPNSERLKRGVMSLRRQQRGSKTKVRRESISRAVLLTLKEPKLSLTTTVYYFTRHPNAYNIFTISEKPNLPRPSLGAALAGEQD